MLVGWVVKSGFWVKFGDLNGLVIWLVFVWIGGSEFCVIWCFCLALRCVWVLWNCV